MSGKENISFQVQITQVTEGNWRGMVDFGSESFAFQSELQLLELVMEHFPALQVDVSWQEHKAF